MNSEEVYELIKQLLEENHLEKYLEELEISEQFEDKLFEIYSQIPIENQKQEIMNLFQVLINYSSNKISIERISKDRKNKTKIKPSVQLRNDINTIKKYQNFLERLYDKDTLMPTNTGLENIIKSATVSIHYENSELKKPYNKVSIHNKISEIYRNNIELIDDLENQKFNIIPKKLYYEKIEENTKNILHDYFNNLVETYNIKSQSENIKKFIDTFTLTT